MPTTPPLISFRLTGQLLLASVVLLALVPESAPAARWEKLIGTGSCEVAFDMDSVRPTTSGRLGVWLRFTPMGKAERKLAAAEYGIKAYRWHLEYYEIDCGNDSAVLGFRDIMGNGGKRLLRQPVGGDTETIVPGSDLDQVGQRVCPVVEETGENPADDSEGDANGTALRSLPETNTTPQARRRITEALKRTISVPSDPQSWSELGNAYYDTDMPHEAIDAYNRSLALKPDNTDVLTDQGAMFRQVGNITQALNNFEKALAIDQHNLECLYNLGYLYAFDLHDIGRAREIWQRYLALDRSSETARQVQSFIDLYSPGAAPIR